MDEYSNHESLTASNESWVLWMRLGAWVWEWVWEHEPGNEAGSTSLEMRLGVRVWEWGWEHQSGNEAGNMNLGAWGWEWGDFHRMQCTKYNEGWRMRAWKSGNKITWSAPSNEEWEPGKEAAFDHMECTKWWRMRAWEGGSFWSHGVHQVMKNESLGRRQLLITWSAPMKNESLGRRLAWVTITTCAIALWIVAIPCTDNTAVCLHLDSMQVWPLHGRMHVENHTVKLENTYPGKCASHF